MFIRFGNDNIVDDLNAQRTAPGRWISKGSEELALLEAERELREAKARLREAAYQVALSSLREEVDATAARRRPEAAKVSQALKERYWPGWFEEQPLTEQLFIHWLIDESVDAETSTHMRMTWVILNKRVGHTNPLWMQYYSRAETSYGRRKPFTLPLSCPTWAEIITKHNMW